MNKLSAVFEGKVCFGVRLNPPVSRESEREREGGGERGGERERVGEGPSKDNTVLLVQSSHTNKGFYVYSFLPFPHTTSPDWIAYHFFLHLNSLCDTVMV